MRNFALVISAENKPSIYIKQITMRKSIFTFFLSLLAVMALAQQKYELSATTSTGDWNFNNGFSISNEAGKNYSTGNGGCIKFSRNVQYTIHIPEGITIKRVTFSGYCNYADADGYLSELNGTAFGETEYVYPRKDDNGNTTVVSHTITLDAPAQSTLTFTPAGQQVVWKIILYDFLEDELPVTEFNYFTPASQMEKLDRALVALPAKSGNGQFVSWRYLGYDDPSTSFDLLRDGQVVAADLTATTSFVDTGGSTNSTYQVVTKVGGVAAETSAAVSPWTGAFKTMRLDRPEGGTNESGSYTYTPNDCGVGDVDGDGEYELFVKWDPSNQKDNSQSGYTGNVYIDCYKLDGTRLWRIDLGRNIRAGAHYTQFLVFDFNGDGKAEMICKTAPGSVDGQGGFVTSMADDSEILSADNTKTYHNASGYVLGGPEYLTVFEGATGKAIHTVFYNPNRAGGIGGAPDHPAKSFWGDNYGNRCDRYLACVAYLDGADKNPSAVMVRGYYTRSYFWAVDFDGAKLTTKWLHASVSANEWQLTDANGNTSTHGGQAGTAYGQGAHNISVADVDGDGCDEIIDASAAIDNNGALLYTTGLGHGDAQHLGDLDPDRPGLEIMMVHEEKPYGLHVREAGSGEIFSHITGSSDTGRGMAADIDPDSRGYEYWSSASGNVYAIDGSVVGTSRPSQCFRLYWTGDLQDELFDGKYNTNTGRCEPIIQKWSSSAKKCQTYMSFSNLGNSQTCNTTKATPNLIADIFGDWREEIIMWDLNDGCTLNIFTTNEPTEYRVPTLMHDHVYRMGIAWQNVAYNQPAHVGYYLPDYVQHLTGIREVSTTANENADNQWYTLSGVRVSQPSKGIYIYQGKKVVVE